MPRKVSSNLPRGALTKELRDRINLIAYLNRMTIEETVRHLVRLALDMLVDDNRFVNVPLITPKPWQKKWKCDKKKWDLENKSFNFTLKSKTKNGCKP